MVKNFFEGLQEKKRNLIKFAAKAAEYSWITQEHFQEIINKLDNDTLTIGVIGQMKCGKSTFLNSFVFEDNILPAATTPMTAALSVITYGREQKIVAEFYSQDEWAEQKLQASRSLEEGMSSIEESKIKAAKELVEKSAKLESRLNEYLGKKQEDTFENLVEYVGADGKYISITKSVTIYYPKEYLKGVEVVDTPGFNDPIVSREEKTKDFLRKADVVLLMLYAGRPFDATDRDILFKNVRQCGIGKVIIGINKYDIPYENGETEELIKQYVKEQIKAACKECKDDTLVEILKESEPIPLSAEMALLSELPSTKIKTDEALEHAWRRTIDIFDVSSPAQIREKSHIDDLVAAIKQVIEMEKGKILFVKPLNSILAAGNDKKGKIENQLQECKSMLQNLNVPDDELESKLRTLKRVEQRLKRKINSLADEIDSVLKRMVRHGSVELEDAVDAACKQMHRIVEDWGHFEKVDAILPKLDNVTQTLVTRTFKREVSKLSDEVCDQVKKNVREFLEDIENEILRISDMESTNCDEFMKRLNNKLEIVVDDDLFKYDSSEEEKDNEEWSDYVFAALNGASFGTMDLALRAFSHDEIKLKLDNYINSLSNDFDPKPMLESIYQNKDIIMSHIEEEILNAYVHPMQHRIEEILSKKIDHNKALQEYKDRCQKLAEEKDIIENQIGEMNKTFHDIGL